jgi:hypothetical protein
LPFHAISSKNFNVILPVIQSNHSSTKTHWAELNLGQDVAEGDISLGMIVPYRYEADHAVVLGKGGMHGVRTTTL